MLTKPKNGWTIFSLEGTYGYELSYLDDIALEWLDQAIFGLETMKPFCVKGFLEPLRFLCVVSYWNCHILIEEDGHYPIRADSVHHEVSYTSMLEFCQYLYEDINQYFDEWVDFVEYMYFQESDRENKQILLKDKLNKLQKLIIEKKENFGEDDAFFLIQF